MLALHLAHFIVYAQQCHEVAAEAVHIVEWVELAEGGRLQQLALQKHYLLLQTLSVRLKLPKDGFELPGQRGTRPFRALQLFTQKQLGLLQVVKLQGECAQLLLVLGARCIQEGLFSLPLLQQLFGHLAVLNLTADAFRGLQLSVFMAHPQQLCILLPQPQG